MLRLLNMINKNETVTIEESLVKFSNSKVVVKLKNGRVISGFLKEDNGVRSIKLGVKHIIVSQENLLSLVAHP